MYEKAKKLGIDYIATGHYAKCEFDEKYNQYVIKKNSPKRQAKKRGPDEAIRVDICVEDAECHGHEAD